MLVQDIQPVKLDTTSKIEQMFTLPQVSRTRSHFGLFRGCDVYSVDGITSGGYNKSGLSVVDYSLPFTHGVSELQMFTSSEPPIVFCTAGSLGISENSFNSDDLSGIILRRKSPKPPKIRTSPNLDSFGKGLYWPEVELSVEPITVPNQTLEPDARNESASMLSEANSKRYALLNFEFEDELKNHLIVEDEAKEAFTTLASELSRINFKDAAVELTPSSAVKITLVVDQLTIMVTKPFKGDLSNNIVVFSIFKDRKLIFSDAAELDSFAEGINKYLSTDSVPT